MRHPVPAARPGAARALLCLAVTALLSAAPARAENPDLSKPCTYTVGDAIADRMQAILRLVAGQDASTVVYYDRETKNVVAEIFGDTDDPDEAKGELMSFDRAIHDGVVGYAKKQYHVTLADKDVTLIYLSGGDEDVPQEVIRREKGVFVTPKADDSDGTNEY
jgi:hypothetical protein